MKDKKYTKIYEPLLQREEIWKGICKYVQSEIPNNSSVLDIGCGYCNFINNIQAKRKIGVDINGDFKKYADKEVEFMNCQSSKLTKIKDNSINVVFCSNLLEHLTSKKVEKTLEEIYRVLKKKGKLILLQPNFYFSYREYFHDYTHKTIFTHVGLSNLLSVKEFNVVEIRPKFLPFSIKKEFMKFKLPPFLINRHLVYLYLKLPFKLFAKQMYVVAKK